MSLTEYFTRKSVLRALFLVQAIALPSLAAADRAELAGTWLHYKSERDPVQLTAAGQAVSEAYNPLRDDSDLMCKPASITNVLRIPDPPFEVRVDDSFVEFDFEYMDVRRRVPIDQNLAAEDAPFSVSDHPQLGRSVAHFDGDALVIETVDVPTGFVDTLREAFPQSSDMHILETYRVEDDRLQVTLRHTDPTYYVEPFTIQLEFIRVDFEVLEFGCTLENAGVSNERLD